MSSIFQKFLSRSTEGSSSLRYTLEAMPSQRKYTFTAATRAEILAEMYDAFWGSYAHLFLPNSNSSLPMHATLSTVQASLGFCGAGKEGPVVPGRPCSRVLKKGESCFRCKDCSLDDSCVICSRCFHATDHQGHNVSFFIAQQPGGCCDCGDPEAWKTPLNCPYHPPGEDTSVRVSVPPDLRDSMARTIGYALDFLLDTLDFSPEEPAVPLNEADLRLQPSADPMMKDQYCLVIWNDDKHSFTEVTKLITDLTDLEHDEASAMTTRIDENGREIIQTSSDPKHLLSIAQAIAQIDLGVTIRRAYDTFREQVAGVIIEWLVDLTQCRLGTDTLILRELIASELFRVRKRSDTHNPNAIILDIPSPTRLEYLFLAHTRLWKKPRLSLKEIYTSILTLGSTHKLTVSGHFARVYHRVIDVYLLVDREAETSIKYFALQLFTVPSVAEHIVKEHKILTRLLGIITSFFTNQIHDKHILLPPSSPGSLNPDSFPFKSKRFMPIFSDLRYLCHNAPILSLIASQPHIYLAEFARTCAMFVGINPNKRQVENHVEFESDGWISVFNVTLSLARVIKVYGGAFGGGRAGTPELVSAIETVIHQILLVCTKDPMQFHQVQFGGREWEVVKFDVGEGMVSFHHSVHWLLAELLKHTDLLRENRLREVGCTSLRDVVRRRASEKAILGVVDFPLRVLALIAQIRTGLWVRNGFAIRGQLLHYRDSMLRELCYDQDLFLVQMSLLLLPSPSHLLISLLDRFGLTWYFTPTPIHSVYDPTQLGGMVEELFYVLITILTEPSHIASSPLPHLIRREVIHALALSPCTYTDLIKRISERLVEDPLFESVLGDVALFRPPEGVSDVGMYELRDACWGEVNPFWYHYTRNKREEVEPILRRKLSTTLLIPRPLEGEESYVRGITDTFESPVLMQILFYAIWNVVGANAPPSGEAILDSGVYLVMVGLVERAEVFSRMASSLSFSTGEGEGEKTLVDILCGMEAAEAWKAYKERVTWVLDRIGEHSPMERKRPMQKKVGGEEGGEDENEKKKKAAKARQEAIIRQMKAQQASFAINFDDEDDDTDLDPERGEESFGTCIVCQENLTSAKPFGTLGMVQPSRFLRKQPDAFGGLLNAVLSHSHPPATASLSKPIFPPPEDPSSSDTPSSSPFSSGSSLPDTFPPTHTKFGLHVSVCTHMMHLECFQVYSVSIRQRHRAQATRNHPESIPRKEYICPLCKSLGNCLIPVAATSNDTSTGKEGGGETSFGDWIRSAGISILKSKPDPYLDSLLAKTGTGEFVFWAAQDSPVHSASNPPPEKDRMVESVMTVTRSISQQTRHLRERHEPEPGERGAGVYLPDEVVSYTIGCIEVSLRGGGTPSVSESQERLIRGLLLLLTKLSSQPFRTRPDSGREALQHALIKRLLPEWSTRSMNTSSTPSTPLVLREPFVVLVETAAVDRAMCRYVVVLVYYAVVARCVIGMVFLMNKCRSTQLNGGVGGGGKEKGKRVHEALFGDIRTFYMSVVRHSPIFEHSATLAFETFGEARVEKMLYEFTLPFLRKAAILLHAIGLTSVSPTASYEELLRGMGIPPLRDLPNQDTLQNALAGWCSQYGHSHASSPLNFGISLDYPLPYRFARLPRILDTLFLNTPTCSRCDTVPQDPAICLLCGATLCAQSACCFSEAGGGGGGRGECNMHMRECGGAMGVYFLVKRSVVLYLYGNGGSFVQGPYLDVHGEVDVGMRRGRRQYLHPGRWEDIRKTWISHLIPTVIARKMEGSLDSGGWESM